MAEGKRFKTFCTDADTNTWQKEAVPKNTRKHTSWGVNVYVDWARSRNENSKDFEPENLKYPYTAKNRFLISRKKKLVSRIIFLKQEFFY